MYYLSQGLKERGFAKLGKVLAVTFAILCIGASFGGGNAAQSNQAALQMVSLFGISGGLPNGFESIIFDNLKLVLGPSLRLVSQPLASFETNGFLLLNGG